jgi:hypothetical protein
MAVSASEFKSLFSEFSQVAQSLINFVVAQADAETDPTYWGELHDAATYWLAAHMLAMRIREVGMFTGATPAKQYQSGFQFGTLVPHVLVSYSSTLYGQEFMRLEQNRLPIAGFVI